MSAININQSLKYQKGSQRVYGEDTTLHKTKNQLKKIGVTRIADITHLDRVGIPVYSAIRPSAAKGAISVYSGKGVTPPQAKISAMMEGFERCLAEKKEMNNNIKEGTPNTEFVDSYDNITDTYNIVNPAKLLISEDVRTEDMIEWTSGWDLINNKEIYVPSNSVYHPYEPNDKCVKLFRSNTNGLAAGNVIEEAILHGLLEVVERDALSIAEMNRNPGQRLKLTREDGISYELMQKFNDANIDVRLWIPQHDTGITTVIASLDDVHLKDPAMLVMGAGTHLNPEIAVIRALTEAAQSRVVQIHGAREDTERDKFVRNIGYERMKRMNSFWYKDKDIEIVTLEELNDFSQHSPVENINTVIDQLKNLVDNAIIVNLSRDSIDVPVVRVIIPTFEMYTLDRERVGKRKNIARKKWDKGEKTWNRRRV
ncbi:MAG: YcaO-related McrA-glycine thioamidation protein [Methanohalobium sp.]|uniref:YcaO-related McrA-glycine thioamidation protein n=1 Tax=Methanohalobium sp. TaxID=2837493 RepID=UPI00397C3D7E